MVLLLSGQTKHNNRLWNCYMLFWMTEEHSIAVQHLCKKFSMMKCVLESIRLTSSVPPIPLSLPLSFIPSSSPQIWGVAMDKILGITLSCMATVTGCYPIGQLTPSAFVPTNHTIAGELFPTMDMIMEKKKKNSPSLGAVWIRENKKETEHPLDPWIPYILTNNICFSFETHYIHYIIH